MKKFFVTTIATAVLASPVLAQEPQSLITGRQSTFGVTPYAGYMWFGNLGTYADGNDLTSDDNWVVGAQGRVRLNSQWAVIGNLAHTRTDFRLQNQQTGTQVPQSGRLGYWLYDAGLQYQLPFRMRGGQIAPFVQGGIGAVRYTAEANNIQSDQQKTDLQFNFGGGLDIDLGPVGLQIMAKDYLTSLDWNDFTAFRQQVGSGDADRGKIANNVALTAGLRINF